ncbi:hypothetical protein Y032_0002g715 [Ancylostoma ceylanicum]|uniref:Uncharacterized protein n=1 Tax=Ancylostoma ceylanicum TaxID=53326 RepID=A0A016W2S9_9BILA|nr:hypothetical protein Y032_0002g715 [Ancylostoma ceylanicum]
MRIDCGRSVAAIAVGSDGGRQSWRPTVDSVGDCCNGAYRLWDFAIRRRCWRSAVANIRVLYSSRSIAAT